MNKVKNIITIQHPESVHHTNGMIGSWTDWELSEKGKHQAVNIGNRLKSELEDKQYLIYSSTLLRTKQTSEIISEILGSKIILTDVLKERSLGRAIGKSVKWLKENIENEEVTVYGRCFSDAESRADVWKRLVPFYKQIVNDEEENIILISHGDTLSIFNVLWLKLDIEYLNEINLSGLSGGVSFLYQTSSGKRIIKRLSDTSYMIDAEKKG